MVISHKKMSKDYCRFLIIFIIPNPSPPQAELSIFTSTSIMNAFIVK